MRKIFLYIILLSALPVFSQGYLSDFFPMEEEFSGKFMIYGDQLANSNSLNNGFLSVLNQSGYLDNETKENQIKMLEENNLFGQVRHIGFEGMIKKNEQLFNFGFQHQSFADAMLSSDIIKAALFGNKEFLGETISIPELQYNSIYLNQLFFGMTHQSVKDQFVQHFNWKINLNFGQNLSRLKIENSSLYTSPDGDALDLDIHLSYLKADSSWNEFYQPAGLGLGGDFYYAIDKPGKFHFHARVGNLGFISWYAYPTNTIVDTAFTFTGVELDTTSGQSFSHPLLSLSLSEDNEFIDVEEIGSSLNFLPLEFSLSSGFFYANQRFYSGFRFLYYPTTLAKPKVEIFTTFNLNNQWFLTPVISSGGFGKTNAGLNIGWKINKNWKLFAGSHHISSFLTSNGKGSSVAISLTYQY